MFKSFRFQIALWFVCLSSLVFFGFTILSGMYFYASLTHSMDDELKVVASQIGHAIDLSGSKPTFRDWLRVVETEPSRSVMSMQLFDPEGKLLEHYGPIGIPKLFRDRDEISEGTQIMRIRHTPLLHREKLVGYLQLQLPAAKRSELTREFLTTLAVMAPIVLLGFGLCGYVVSGIAARPIIQLIGTLQRFVADAGHELNTPASIVQAKAEALGRKLAKKGLYEEDVNVISSAAERMGFIVKNLMLLAELDGKREASSNYVVDLNSLAKSVSAGFRERFSAKSISFSYFDIERTIVLANKESLECVISNLLENALNYTEPGGKVSVSCSKNGADACLAVEDTGLGIPAESIPFIFERFYRVDKSRSRKSGGTGLGLSIVKAIVVGLGGKVEVESCLGKGSKFIVSLPLSKSVAQKLHTSK